MCELDLLQTSIKQAVDDIAQKLPGRRGEDVLRFLTDVASGSEQYEKMIVCSDSYDTSVRHPSTLETAIFHPVRSMLSGRGRTSDRDPLRAAWMQGRDNVTTSTTAIMQHNSITCIEWDRLSSQRFVAGAVANEDNNSEERNNGGTNRLLAFDVASQEAIGLHGHINNVHAIRQTNDGAYFLTGGTDKRIIMWNAQTRLQEHIFPSGRSNGTLGHLDLVCDIAVPEHDNDYFASCGFDDIFLWSLTERRCIANISNLQGDEKLSPTSCTFGKDVTRDLLFVPVNGSTMVPVGDFQVAPADVLVFQYDRQMSQSTPLFVLRNPDPYVHLKGVQIDSCCDISPCGRFLAYGSDRGTVALFDARTATCIHAYSGTRRRHNAPVSCVEFSHCGRYFVECSNDCRLLVSDIRMLDTPVLVAQHNEPRESMPIRDGIADCSWAHQSPLVVTAGQDSCIRVWDIASGSEIYKYCYPDGKGMTTVAFAPSDRAIAAGDNMGFIHLVSFDRGQSVASRQTMADTSFQVSISLV